MSTELKKDSLDAIVTFLAVFGETPLLTARANLATGANLTKEALETLKAEGYDLTHHACYAEKDPKDPKDIRVNRIAYRVTDPVFYSKRLTKFRYTVYEEDGTEDGKHLCTFESKAELKKVIEMCGWCVVGGEEFLED